MTVFKSIVVLLLLITVFGSGAFCQQFPYRFNYLTVDVGLSHTDANDIGQDKQGYIWIATFFGLDRYDGYNVKRFYNTNEPLNNALNNRLRCLSFDEDGNVWLGTEGGLECFNSKTEKYIAYRDSSAISQPTFWKIIKKGAIVYGLANEGLKVYTLKGQAMEAQGLTVPSGINFTGMTLDPSGNLYLSGNKGVWLLDKNRVLRNIVVGGLPAINLSRIDLGPEKSLLISGGNQLFLTKGTSSGGGLSEEWTVVKRFVGEQGIEVRDVAVDEKINYWCNTGSGLLRLDSNLRLIQTITNHSSLSSLNSSSLNRVFIDRSQCMWVCTFGSGVDFCDLNEKKFYTLQHNPEVTNSLSGNFIRSILDEDGKYLWVGTTYSGLNLYDYSTRQFTFYNATNSPVRLKTNDVSALVLDKENNLWIGSSAGIQILRPNRAALWTPAGSEDFPKHVIETLTEDYYGNIWFGDHMNRFGVIWKDAQNVFRVKYYGEGYFILSDPSKPELFVSSTHGLKRLLIDRAGNVLKTFEYKATGKANSLSSDYTYPVCKENDSTYWIGTIGGGLNLLTIKTDDTYSIRSWTGSLGVLPDVETMELDDSGHVWMGGNGLQFFNPVTGKLIRYDKNDGLQGNSFKVNASYKSKDGRLFFGGINGLNYFNPAEIKPNLVPARPKLTDLLINNERPAYGTVDGAKTILPATISFSGKLKLNYLQNNFVISFSAMHYANPSKCRYRYRLLGFDKDWKYTDGTNPAASYSNLDYSDYTFIVEATNNDGVWSTERASVSIEVTPPWWDSLPARTIYVLLVISGLLGLYFYQARWYRLKRELAVRAVDEKKREEMHQQREDLYQQQLQFFTNISHEFRTPLTLILGPLERLIKDHRDPAASDWHMLMFRNVRRLINLINELMNFKKVADSAIKLQVRCLAITPFCKNLYLEFESLAASKDIGFTLVDHAAVTAGGQPLSNYFDPQILEKILFNLLNNSFKYTNAGGQVRIEIFFDLSGFKPSFATEFHLLNESHRAKSYIYFLIADTGIGISKESIGSIFDRYYRISKNHLGSGVGLALVKSLTQLHKGNISVYSERYKGTEIIVALPWGKENYTDDEVTSDQNDTGLSQLEFIDSSILSTVPVRVPDHQHLTGKLARHILLVEDNQELRSFLRQTLESFYYVHEAEDGKAGLEIAQETIPDLIISDVMMPGMSGIEFCLLVKNNFETSHIPFIILSAKDALDTKIEGLESGADHYFAKPLSMDLLLLTIHNIFEQGQKLKLKYTNNYLTEATELVHSEKDKEFMNKLLGLIEANIEAPFLDVDFLCSQLFISRTKLYQKIKSISDQSVGEFIKTIRLKKAIQIMTHEDVPLSKVADRIGLQSASYFSRVFKKEFGKSPSEFVQDLKKGAGGD